MPTPLKTTRRDPPREDLFTPIHKALRAMIYDLGAQLQTADFTDVPATEKLLAELRHEMTAATQSTCVLCVLHDHAGHEETGIFPQLQRHEPKLIEEMFEAHREIVRKLTSLAKVCDELLACADPDDRVTLGKRVSQQSNALFAYYLGHMNREEEAVVPVTWKYFTDDELVVFRGKIMASIPPHEMTTILRWMLPSLNVHELTHLFSGLKIGAPPPLLHSLVQVAEREVEPARWETVSQRVGL